ncbi:histone-lysine N-methyltransferase PRDM9 [Genypterus blacodes]|uniref:histone-lysine N-methyltransferase PRDM9 n=1 Tax=Genypterus blacodes TaxID=154954 RepID=UPI003F76D065
MANRRSVVEWVETTEEVVATEENLPPDDCPHEGCEECLTLFHQQTDPSTNNGPSFILNFPASAGVPQRALLTLPYGLMVGRSSIPSVGVGVINQGAAVSPGMHFGPYEGEVSTKEKALASDFSWEIYKGKDEYEYIDAARESHSNWMRYVKFARNEDEKNLVAVQYKGTIIFHCCRSINAGEELMVWPSSKLSTQLSEAWNRVWCVKLNAAVSNAAATSEIFTCCYCQLSFTTEAYLQLHTEYFHLQPEGRSAVQTVLRPTAPQASSSEDPVRAKTCSDCGKSFKQIRHLRRHKRCVHQNKRPYCCQQCRRSFSQASGFIRHQLTHKKQGLVKERMPAPDQDKEETPPHVSEPTKGEEAAEMIASGNLQETVAETETENRMSEVGEHLVSCSDCGQSFSNGAVLKEHKVTAHSVLRPYVCSVCRMCFRQYCDLARHLQRHKTKGQRTEQANPSQGETSAAASFPCTDCSLAFPSEDALQQHRSVHQSEETPETTPLANQEPVSAGDNLSLDPDFTPSVVRSPSQRPQRVGARSKLSALTKLIAPKRRAPICRKSLPSGAAQAERDGGPEAPDATELTPKNGSGKGVKYKWYSCSHCKVTFTEPDELEAHRCTWKQHKCDQCGATFKKIGFLKRHERVVHTEAKSYSCDNCGTAFSKPGKLEQHKKACEKYYCTSELFPCSFCQFSFTMKRYLVKHIRRHHPVEFVSQCDSLMDQLEEDEEEEEEEMEEKEYSCPHCAKSYLSARAYKAHTCFQQVKILYLCTDCGKGFTNQYSLKQHQRIHTGEKPYSCPHCAKSFTYTGQLNVHLRTHTGEKPYLCTHCGESFRQSGDLKRHERKHTGVRPYSCPDCCKSFSRPQSLKAHQMLHLGQRMFKCTQCGKSFSRNYHLRRHHQKMHS